MLAAGQAGWDGYGVVAAVAAPSFGAKVPAAPGAGLVETQFVMERLGSAVS